MVRAYELLAEARRLAAAPRCHRGRSGVPGHHQVRGRLRRPAVQGDRRHDPGLASAPPVEEVKVGIQILQSLNLRPRKLEIVSCPSCGRAQVDVYTLADEVTAGLEGLEVPLRVAVMGCVVNGPGEAREADLGVASGNGKGQIFVRGEVIKTVPEKDDRRDPHRGGDAHRRVDGAPIDEAAAGLAAGHRRLTRPTAPAHVGCRRRPPAPARRPAGRSSAPRVVGLQPSGHGSWGQPPVQREQPSQHRHQHDVEAVQDADDEQNAADAQRPPAGASSAVTDPEMDPRPQAARSGP